MVEIVKGQQRKWAGGAGGSGGGGVWVHLELNWHLRPSPTTPLLPFARKHHLVWLEQVDQTISIECGSKQDSEYDSKTKATKSIGRKGLVQWRGWWWWCIEIVKQDQSRPFGS